MDDISKRILEGTLSNDISVAELLRRQKTFAADSELPPELQARGQSFFNTALYTDTPATLREGREVVAILRRTMEAIGSLYLEHQQRQGSAQYSDDTGGEVMNGIEQTTEVEGKEDCTTDSSAHYRNDDELSHNPRIQAAIAARRRHRGLTHGRGPRKGMSVTAGVLKALRRPIQTANAMLSGLVNTTGRQDAPANKVQQNSSTSNTSDRKLRSKDSGKKLQPARSKQSLIVKLHVPTLDTHASMTKRKPTKKRAPGAKTKSEGFVISDNEEAKNKGNEGLARSENIRDVTMPDAPDLRPRHSKRSTCSASSGTSANPHRLSASPQVTRSQASNSASWESASSTSSSSSSELSAPPSNLATPAKRLFTAITESKRSNTSTSLKQAHASVPSNTSSKTSQPNTISSYTFPPLPSFPLQRRPKFHLGATIALSNLLEDHAAFPDETFLELIEDLEDNRPTFTCDDWEHRTILKGGTWVYDVLRKAAGFGPKPKPPKDDGGDELDVEKVMREDEEKRKKQVEFEERMDFIGMVGGLKKWVDKEWERVRALEKGVVVVEDDAEDNCGCGSATPEAEELPEKKRRKK